MSTRACCKLLAMGEQAMQAGDADIEDALDAVAHDFGGDGGFFGDRRIAGAGRDDDDGALSRQIAVLPEHEGAGQRIVRGLGNALLDGGNLLGRNPRGQHVVAGAGGQAAEDFAQLRAGDLPGPKITSGMPERRAR